MFMVCSSILQLLNTQACFKNGWTDWKCKAHWIQLAESLIVDKQQVLRIDFSTIGTSLSSITFQVRLHIVQSTFLTGFNLFLFEIPSQSQFNFNESFFQYVKQITLKTESNAMKEVAVNKIVE